MLECTAKILIYVFPVPISQFLQSCVCERFIYSHDRSTYFPAAEYADRSWEHINRTQKYECWNCSVGKSGGLKDRKKIFCRRPLLPQAFNFQLAKFCPGQGCESRRQTFSSITGPTFRDFGKVSALPRSLTLLGKKVSPGSGPLFGFSRPNPAGNEIPIANR